MSESDDENLLYAPTDHQGKGLLGNGVRVKNVSDVLNDRNNSEKRRLKKTIALCGAFIGLGLALAVVGPTLQELKTHLKVGLPTVSYIFTGRSIGYVLGSILGGVTFEYFHPLLLIASTLAMSGIGLLVTPYCEHMMSSVFAMSFVGIAMGALDTGANVVCLRMWGKRSAPFMQALHFSFALGAFIAPLLAGPFLAVTPSITSNNIMLPTTHAPTSNLPLTITTPNSSFVSTIVGSGDGHESEINIDVSSPTSSTKAPTAAPKVINASTTDPLNVTKPSTPASQSTELITSTVVEIVTETSTTEDSESESISTTSTPIAQNSSPINKTEEHSNSKRDTKSVNRKHSPEEDILQYETKNAAQEYRTKYSRSSRRLLGQNEQKSNSKLTFHAEDDDHLVKSKRKNKHWRSRIMLSVGEKNASSSKMPPTSQPTITASSSSKNPSTAPKTSAKTTKVHTTAINVAVKTTAAPMTKPKERFQYPYIMISIFLILMSLIFLYLFCTSATKMKSSGLPSTEGTLVVDPSSNNFTNYILALLFIFYFLYVGSEVGYGGFIYTFAIDDRTVEFTSANATQLNSVFWGTFAFGRGISICIASVLSPLNMVLLDIAGCIVSSLALAYQGDSNSLVLWIGTATLGLSMASLFPAGISWLESHATVTGNMASFLIVGAAFGEMAVPVLLGYLFESDTGPISLMYVMSAVSVLTAGIFGVTVYLAHNGGKIYDPLPKEDVLEDIITGLSDAIEPGDIPFPTFGVGQTPKPIFPKLKKKKHKE